MSSSTAFDANRLLNKIAHETCKAERDNSASNPGPQNFDLAKLNPNSDVPALLSMPQGERSAPLRRAEAGPKQGGSNGQLVRLVMGRLLSIIPRFAGANRRIISVNQCRME